MFDFAEAERRLRLGAIGIKRQAWHNEYLYLWPQGNEHAVKVYDVSKGLWDITDEDKNSADWIDPAE